MLTELDVFYRVDGDGMTLTSRWSVLMWPLSRESLPLMRLVDTVRRRTLPEPFAAVPLDAAATNIHVQERMSVFVFFYG